MLSCSGSAVVEQSNHHSKAKGSNLAPTDTRREKLSQHYMKESDMFSCSGSAVVKQLTHHSKAKGSNLATTDTRREKSLANNT
jgi:hypothetical protein